MYFHSILYCIILAVIAIDGFIGIFYEGNIETDKTDEYEILEEIFTLLNVNHPEDYTGHSLSVSDIVVLNNKKYYCDSYGWVEN